MSYPIPTPGASLLLAFSPSPNNPQSILFISSTTSSLTSQRIFSSLEASFLPYIATKETTVTNNELRYRVEEEQIRRVDFDSIASDAGDDEWKSWFDHFETQVDTEGNCRLIVMNDSIGPHRTEESLLSFSRTARRKRYSLNIADRPDLSDFSWPTTHRFPLSSSSSSPKSPLQLALTTNTNACRLSLRIKRELVASLPGNVGAGVLAIGQLRKSLRVREEEELLGCEFNRPVEQLTRETSRRLELDALEVDLEAERELSPCRARRASRGELSGEKRDRSSSISTRSTTTASSRTPSSAPTTTASLSTTEAHLTRMRYVAQISEYWPLDRLASVSLSTLSSTSLTSLPLPNSLPNFSRHDLLPIQDDRVLSKKKGRIFLLGTGPGSPLLLTRLAHLFLTTSDVSSPYYVDLFLSDKLVPPEILALIPGERRAHVVIAKKYPGNAEHAQDELMRLAIEGAEEGKTVLRMKQGDPYLYGRGGEEVLHIRKNGYESTIVPGLSSCLAGPGLFNIPVTQRGVAESVVVCTGVGRGGREVIVDAYSRSKTLVVLMGVARLASLIPALLNHPVNPYPSYLPIALIERASSPDQRAILATLETIEDVLKSLDAHRPPGMLVIGWSVLALEGEGDMKVLDEEKEGEARDKERVERWLEGRKCIVKEGGGEGWAMFRENKSAKVEEVV